MWRYFAFLECGRCRGCGSRWSRVTSTRPTGRPGQAAWPARCGSPAACASHRTPPAPRSCSGMLPGYVSGAYSYDDCHIDLVRLARFANARLIHTEAEGIDAQVRCPAGAAGCQPSRASGQCSWHRAVGASPFHSSSPQAQQIRLRGRPHIGYDVLSLNVGITPATAWVPGAVEHATPVKPIDRCGC